MSDVSFVITSVVASHISVAFHQNAVPVVYEITLHNGTEEDIADVELTIVSEPAFALPLNMRVERIAAGATHHVRTPNLQLDAGFLRKITEGIRGSLSIKAAAGTLVSAEEAIPVQLYPPSHWGGGAAAPELLAAFVRPNDAAVEAVLRDAASKLAAAGKNSALDGYRTGSRQRAWELAGAIWSALASRGIAYVLPPASFERSGQKVRGPSDILERRLATCLDTTLLFAACLEQAGLNPVVVLTAGHAFVGLWLKDDGFSAAIVDDMQILRKRRDLEDMIFIETTLLTHTPPARFQQAVDHAARLIGEDAIDALEMALDIRRARARGIKPLELGDASSTVRPTLGGPDIDLGLDQAPSFIEEVVVRDDEDGTVDRLERWKRKLLDLTLRNKLLNFKDTKKGIVIECPNPARLEDLLAAGQRFKLLPRTDVLAEGDQRDASLFQEQRHDDGRRHFVLEALERFELHANVTEGELDARLTDLFRMTRTAFEEGGSNVLFLALGFLKWTQKDGSKPCRAPLILLPVSLQRSSVRAGFRLVVHEEEARFNPTLLQMLRQDQKLVMPELEKGLPTDADGLDVARIWQIVRTHIRDLKGWEVTPDVVLSTFSFTKFLMWKDLVDRMDMLKRNPVVKHLIDTPKHTYGDGSPFSAPESMDRDHHPADIFAPLSADSSQLSAVLAAAGGKDFVLFGPPGTGKSQTIGNMISQCLALGKTVLFVSQKTAALEVVQRRLRDIGLGEY